MNIVEPSVEYWPQGAGMEGVWNQIARATRVCYQSKPRKGESSEDFVKRIILKPALVEGSLDDLGHCRFDFDKMHGAMLEHGTVYLDIDSDLKSLHELLVENPYSIIVYNHPIIKKHFFVTTNMRVIIENNLFELLEDWMVDAPTEHHAKRYTFSVIADIGVTREMNRHRTFSVAEQSTRCCDFSKDKFGSELTYMLPQWFMGSNKIVEEEYKIYAATLESIENSYKKLRKLGWKPEQARQVLPLGLKTQAVYTAFTYDWEHFLRLRADNVSGKAHPNIQLVAKKIQDIIKTL